MNRKVAPFPMNVEAELELRKWKALGHHTFENDLLSQGTVWEGDPTKKRKVVDHVLVPVHQATGSPQSRPYYLRSRKSGGIITSPSLPSSPICFRSLSLSLSPSPRPVEESFYGQLFTPINSYLAEPTQDPEAQDQLAFENLMDRVLGSVPPEPKCGIHAPGDICESNTSRPKPKPVPTPTREGKEHALPLTQPIASSSKQPPVPLVSSSCNQDWIAQLLEHPPGVGKTFQIEGIDMDIKHLEASIKAHQDLLEAAKANLQARIEKRNHLCSLLDSKRSEDL
ncbi:hypothetical protein FA13DRAFT_1720571 [Coprinellus micaceus]|uniref:Uncharacterized protein n=1 Tax=Coprinellus micaceus TaxID=71717 RepID=A0A4Y7S7Q5_COPMI|nr:hypothetical protein FA13DRAFT_1720571 [Coprinellus micaceus]